VANIERLDRALKQRRELAQLHGKADYATYALTRRMAGNLKAVTDFLDRVRDAVVELQKRGLAELRAEKAAVLGKPMDQVRVQPSHAAALCGRQLV